MQREETIKAVWDVLVKILFQEDSDAYIDILGGTIEIDAKGDGIDSNGDFSVSGGVIYVSGPGMTETELWIMTEQRPSQVEQSLQQA